jgi:hypothetical protein
MQRFLISSLVFALALTLAGCGDGRLHTQGRLVKGGQAYIPSPDQGAMVAVMFVPIPPDGKPAHEFIIATVDQATGTFSAAGKDMKGMPPGKYRVAVQLLKKKQDLFHGKYDTEKSPFVFDIDANTKELVVDLDKS